MSLFNHPAPAVVCLSLIMAIFSTITIILEWQTIKKRVKRIFGKSFFERTIWWHKQKQWFFGIITPTVLLYFIFASPPIALVEEAKPRADELAQMHWTTNEGDLTAAGQMIMSQVGKCTNEIQMRLEQEEHWFDMKFTSLGLLVFGFFAQAIFREKISEDHSSEGVIKSRFFQKILTSPLSLTVLVIACAFSMIADMHIRSNRMVIAQNGIWVAEYAEPALYGIQNNAADSGVNTSEKVAVGTQAGATEATSVSPAGKNKIVPKFRGWEGFLRIRMPRSGDASKTFSGYHENRLYNLTFWPQMFLVTVALYAVYIYLFMIYCRESARDATGNRLTKTGYIALHVMICVCAFTTHSVPSTFQVNILGVHYTPEDALLVYGLLGLMLCLFSYVGIYRYFGKSPVRTGIGIV